jgi:hypothetical protein
LLASSTEASENEVFFWLLHRSWRGSMDGKLEKPRKILILKPQEMA